MPLNLPETSLYNLSTSTSEYLGLQSTDEQHAGLPSGNSPLEELELRVNFLGCPSSSASILDAVSNKNCECSEDGKAIVDTYNLESMECIVKDEPSNSEGTIDKVSVSSNKKDVIANNLNENNTSGETDPADNTRTEEESELNKSEADTETNVGCPSDDAELNTSSNKGEHGTKSKVAASTSVKNKKALKVSEFDAKCIVGKSRGETNREVDKNWNGGEDKMKETRVNRSSPSPLVQMQRSPATTRGKCDKQPYIDVRGKQYYRPSGESSRNIVCSETKAVSESLAHLKSEKHAESDSALLCTGDGESPEVPARKKSTGMLPGGSPKRISRSPKRNASPPRRLSSANGGEGASLAQTKDGFRSISKHSSASPNRKIGVGKLKSPKTGRASSFRVPTFCTESLASPTLPNVSPTRKVSPSPTLESRKVLSTRAPSPSPAVPNIHPPGSATQQHPVPNRNPQRAAPDDQVWYAQRPHGDMQQTFQKKDEQVHVSEVQHARRRSPIQPRIGDTLHSPTANLKPVSPARTCRVELGLSPQTSGAAMKGAQDPRFTRQLLETKMSPVYSDSAPDVQTSSGASAHQRGARRHPVLDRMFRAVLTSLVKESGPPSSSRLATVLDPEARAAAMADQRSNSTRVSPSESFSFPTSRLRELALRSNVDVSTMDSTSADVTMTFLDLPRHVTKIVDELPAGKSSPAAATADA